MSVSLTENVFLFIFSRIMNTEDRRKCVFCDEHVSKTDFSTHNRMYHAVLHFKWNNGKVETQMAPGQQVVPKIIGQQVTPVVQNNDIDTNVLPIAPFVVKPTAPVAVTLPAQHLPNLLQKQTINSDTNDSNNIEYDMDISADSRSDSDDIDGNSFHGLNTKRLRKNTNDSKVSAVELKPTQPSDNQPQIARKSRDIEKADTNRSSTEELPTLSVEINDNCFELILTTKVYSKSNSEYGTFPVRTKLKREFTVPKMRRKRHSLQSSTSTF